MSISGDTATAFEQAHTLAHYYGREAFDLARLTKHQQATTARYRFWVAVELLLDSERYEEQNA
mgnify:CR=1 FL=1|tara:strand:+ start:4276 stop:4464 length:189 start_codon:yes stop_codon:yes gene_type:complete